MLLEIVGVFWVDTTINFIIDALGVKQIPEEMKELYRAHEREMARK